MTSTNNSAKFGIHWFRRDLRIFANQALRENWKTNEGRVLGLFCFDSNFLSRDDFSHNRFAFFLDTLKSLKQEFSYHGGDLLVVDCQPDQAFEKLFAYFKKNNINLPTTVSWNKDYEPFARKRDQKIEQWLTKLQIQTITARDHLLLEPHEVCKSDKAGDYYQIYSPFAKKWFSLLSQPDYKKRIDNNKDIHLYYEKLKTKKIKASFELRWENIKSSSFPFKDALEIFVAENSKQVSIDIPSAGSLAAYEQMMQFADKVKKYKNERDLPAVDGTSKLSMYLKNGSLTSSQILYCLGLTDISFFDETHHAGAMQFKKEICWREFYYSILWHKPSVEHESFNPNYINLKWQNNTTWFELWQEGKTGFPIIDAGMRELKQTGWMHNRVRMIVASFLTKDLLINWQWGENYFMKTLLDGDLAANNGGWQWAASTGCDPQPYFRIFNPWLQSKKFDPHGEYIKKFIPELKNAPNKVLHDPTADRSIWGYPKPIVDHGAQREKAIRFYTRNKA